MPERRTPLVPLLVGVTKLLLRRAMIGWMLRAFGVVVLCLVPLAVVSSWGSLEPSHRAGVLLAAGAVAGAAVFLLWLGRYLRSG
ncbi:hypothetical protein FJZ36_03005 [Candidatus Poribacteria bacterium]|nr:hypothetical protein [Candidatus Poribacteria bacterium]